jgi:hypothetical protein
MPQVRKLSLAEVATLEYKPASQRKLIEEQYDAILSDYDLGDYGEAQLEPEDYRLTVRNRLIAAAKRRGFGINFRRTNRELLRFQIIAQNGEIEVAPAEVVPAAPEPVIELLPAPKKRAGRPKKKA